MNGILTEHLKGVLVQNNFQLLFNREIKTTREFFMQATFIVSLLQGIATH